MKNKTDKITSTTEVKRGKADVCIETFGCFKTHKDKEKFLDWIDSLFPEFNKVTK